jgi:hypothetical protein
LWTEITYNRRRSCWGSSSAAGRGAEGGPGGLGSRS